jgi:hypothetical protein
LRLLPQVQAQHGDFMPTRNAGWRKAWLFGPHCTMTVRAGPRSFDMQTNFLAAWFTGARRDSPGTITGRSSEG